MRALEIQDGSQEAPDVAPSGRWTPCLTALLAGALLASAVGPCWIWSVPCGQSYELGVTLGETTCEPRSGRFRVAFVGNSFTYYNDMPHFVSALLNGSLRHGFEEGVEVGVWVRGGSSLPKLCTNARARASDAARLHDRDVFSSLEELLAAPCGWDAVVLQDQSQRPARPGRQRSLDALASCYAPQLRRVCGGAPLVVLYQTWAYREPVKKSASLGDVPGMTSKLVAGYEAYASALNGLGFETVSAPAGAAFRAVHDENSELWRRLFEADNIHPSALGSVLIGTHISYAIATSKRFSAAFPLGAREPDRWPASLPLAPGSEPAPTMREIAAALRIARPFTMQFVGGP